MDDGTPQRVQSLIGERGIEDAVLTCVKLEGKKSNKGITVADCVAYFQEEVSEGDIYQAFHDLAFNGYIYSTVDEYHYKFAGE